MNKKNNQKVSVWAAIAMLAVAASALVTWACVLPILWG